MGLDLIYQTGWDFGSEKIHGLGRISDLRKYTGLDLGLGSICHTGWVGFWICENSQVRIWVWVQSARQVGISDLKKYMGFGYGFVFNF